MEAAENVSEPGTVGSQQIDSPEMQAFAEQITGAPGRRCPVPALLPPSNPLGGLRDRHGGACPSGSLKGRRRL